MTVSADRFDDELRGGTRIELPTPEGVPLVFVLASVGERAYAFSIDCLFAGLPILAIALFAALAVAADAQFLFALLLFAFFVLRNGWFLGHELRSGRTPGKRRTALRVVDARGGPLMPLSVVVRNLTREVELFVPLILLGNPEHLTDQGPGLVRALAVLWVAGFAVVPLLDPRRRRLGDLLAGTIVVRDPRHALLPDLLARDADAPRPELAPRFSQEQLAHYGIYELQVLEELLRKEARQSAVLDAVAAKVAARIGWLGPLPGGARAFLAAFYEAQRGRLERDLTLGRARVIKAARSAPSER
ncbi:MAG: RDD family protein [Planctomycetes bacterium]|nr:RDD family protein [Planctomycetota bacterium]